MVVIYKYLLCFIRCMIRIWIGSIKAVEPSSVTFIKCSKKSNVNRFPSLYSSLRAWSPSWSAPEDIRSTKSWKSHIPPLLSISPSIKWHIELSKSRAIIPILPERAGLFTRFWRISHLLLILSKNSLHSWTTQRLMLKQSLFSLQRF